MIMCIWNSVVGQSSCLHSPAPKFYFSVWWLLIRNCNKRYTKTNDWKPSGNSWRWILWLQNNQNGKDDTKNIDYFGMLGSYCQVQSHLNTVLLFSLIGKNFLWVELHETRTC